MARHLRPEWVAEVKLGSEGTSGPWVVGVKLLFGHVLHEFGLIAGAFLFLCVFVLRFCFPWHGTGGSRPLHYHMPGHRGVFWQCKVSTRQELAQQVIAL